MAGITSYGAYIPLWRLSRDAIAAAWGRNSLGGERSVANNDEDTLTMASEAASDCLNGVNREGVDGVYFASTTPPFKEKECSTFVANVVDLRPEIITADYGYSLRSGTAALRAALHAVDSGFAKSVLVTASDCRLGYPRSDYEQSFGDAAAALLIGNTTKAAVRVEDSYSISNEIYDVWRLDKDNYVQSWEDRFIIEHGYTDSMQKAISGLMKKQNLSPKDITKAVFYGPTIRAQQTLARNLGLDVKTQVQDLLMSNVGISGCAHALLMLVAALEEAKPGDRLLLASYGNGSDAFLLRVTDSIEKIKDGRRGVRGFLKSKAVLPGYAKYLSYRGMLEPQPGEPFRTLPAATKDYQTRNWSIHCHGSKCKDCGLITFPIQRICYNCQSKDNYEEIRLSDKKGKIFTYCLDQLAGRSDDPVVPQIVVESELGNARLYCLMTDCDPSQIRSP